MQRTLSQLRRECAIRGIELDSFSKYKRRDYVKLLAEQTLWNVDIGYGLEKRLSIESPMLCFPFKHLREDQKDECLESSSWIAEEKYNGARMLISFHEDEGFRFFGRNVSVVDFLPIEYTEKILLIKGESLALPNTQAYGGSSWVIDCEVIIEGDKVDTSVFQKNRGTEILSELNACSAILALETELSHEVQTTQASLQFRAFDLLYIDDVSYMEKPFLVRKRMLRQIVERLKLLPFFSIEDSVIVSKNRLDFFNQLLEEGKEGIVLKRIDQPYVPLESRRRDTQVKLKRTMLGAAITDVDAYIIGAIPASPDKAWRDYIGSLKLAVFLEKEDGTVFEHYIATVAGIPMELRKKFTTYDSADMPVLNTQFLGTVLAINGQSISSKSLRFMHAVIEWGNEPVKADKRPEDCVMTEEFLRSQIF